MHKRNRAKQDVMREKAERGADRNAMETANEERFNLLERLLHEKGRWAEAELGRERSARQAEREDLDSWRKRQEGVYSSRRTDMRFTSQFAVFDGAYVAHLS